MSPGAWVGAASRGVAWGLVSTATTRSTWLLATAVLARLLVPEDFGLFALGLLYLLYVETFSDLGLSAALIQWPGDERSAAQATFVSQLVVGVLGTVATLSAAGFLAEALRSPEAAPVFRALAPSFLLRALGNTHDALCQKRLRFRARFLPEAGLSLAKAGTGIGLALAGWGVWSLVVAQLVGLGVWVTALWWVEPWRPSLELPRGEELRRLLRFGRWIVVVNLLSAVVHHADKLVVGRQLGTEALGLYQLAAKTLETSITVLIWVVGRVLFPAFSKLHAAGESLATAYLGAVRAIGLVALPAAAVLAVAAEPLLATVFGATWRPAAPVLQVLAIYGAARAVGSSAGDVLKASGASRTLAGLALAKAGILIPCLALAASRGAVAVAAALALATVVGVGVDVATVTRRLSLSIADYLRSVGPGLLSALASGAAAAGAATLLDSRSELTRLLAIGAAAAAPALGFWGLLAPGPLARRVRSARPSTQAGEEGAAR